MLEVHNVKKYYDDFLAVDSVSFTLREGEALGLIGANGAGKSTTIKTIIGLVEPSEGHVLIDGKTMSLDALALKQKIGYMPEESALYEDMDALGFLSFFADIYHVPAKRAKELIAQLLVELKLANKIISTMSKGMKRKLLIARSLLADPKILVYDEPASGIDPETTAFIIEYILSLKKKGKIIIMTGHNLSHVEKIADRIIMMHKGKVVLDDTVHHIKQKKTYVLRYKEGHSIHEQHFSDIKEVNDALGTYIKKGIQIIDFRQKEPSLEEVFLELVRR